MRAWLERSFRNRIFLTVLLVALVPLLLCDVLMTQVMIFRSEHTLRTDAQEEMALLNAVPTAEAAIELALSQLPITLWESRCLLTGFGRCAKPLARLLTAFGAQLTVCARSPKDLALARSFGLTALPLAQMDTLLPQQQLIFNTVPAPILGKEQLRLLPHDCLLIDLASGAGGIDHLAARSLGLRCLHSLALPAKTAPVTAGNILCDTVIQMITDIQSKTR